MECEIVQPHIPEVIRETQDIVKIMRKHLDAQIVFATHTFHVPDEPGEHWVIHPGEIWLEYYGEYPRLQVSKSAFDHLLAYGVIEKVSETWGGILYKLK